MGMRVRAVWKPRERVGTTADATSTISAPTGEPDAAYESYAHHCEGRPS